MSNNYHLYLGRAGHLAVMSEFLLRGWNVAIPEIDIGDDIYVVHDGSGSLKRVQVKSATCNIGKRKISGQFLVPIKQLTELNASYTLIGFDL